VTARKRFFLILTPGFLTSARRWRRRTLTSDRRNSIRFACFESFFKPWGLIKLFRINLLAHFVSISNVVMETVKLTKKKTKKNHYFTNEVEAFFSFSLLCFKIALILIDTVERIGLVAFTMMSNGLNDEAADLSQRHKSDDSTLSSRTCSFEGQ
jgi:hypothetical protein